MKILSSELMSFIESLSEKYSLDREIIAKMQDLDKEYFDSVSSSEKQALKFIFSKEAAPSLSLKFIIEKLINKELEFTDLPKEICNNLSIDKNISEQIAKDIAASRIVINKINEPEKDYEEMGNSPEIPPRQKGGVNGIGQELQ